MQNIGTSCQVIWRGTRSTFVPLPLSCPLKRKTTQYKGNPGDNFILSDDDKFVFRQDIWRLKFYLFRRRNVSLTNFSHLFWRHCMRGEKIWMLPIVTLSPFRFSNNKHTRGHRSCPPPPFSQTKSTNKLIVSLILNVIWSPNNVFQVCRRDASLSRWQGARSEANQKVRCS